MLNCTHAVLQSTDDVWINPPECCNFARLPPAGFGR
jgi:hypothetical protein